MVSTKFSRNFIIAIVGEDSLAKKKSNCNSGHGAVPSNIIIQFKVVGNNRFSKGCKCFPRHKKKDN